MQVFEQQSDALLAQLVDQPVQSRGISARFVERSGETQQRVLLTLSGNKLFVRRPSGVYEVQLVKTRFSLIETEELPGFRLARGQRSMLLFSSDRENFKLHYEIGSQIGSGSSSRVYFATRLSDNSGFAVKVFRSTAEFYEMIRNEVFMLRQTSVISAKLYQVFVEQDKVYLVLAFAERGDLISYLRGEGRGQFCKLVPEVMFLLLSSLKVLHGLNIIHRDIKPENIVFNAKKQLRLIDFGTACYANTKECEISCGTPSFVAPEVIAGKYCDEKCDIFSAGLVFYLLLTGRKAFEGTIEEVRGLVAKGSVAIPERVRGVERQLLGKMLDFNPSTRLSAEQALAHPYFVNT